MIKTFDALHDTPHGTVPGVAVAVYGGARPEAVHTAAAWVGLTGNLPGVAVFHTRPTGPDTLHRVRVSGSGLDIRSWLDRAGLTDRVLIPHKTGFDVLIPDRGSVMGQRVRAFARHHKVALEASRGHFSQVGSQDQVRAREMFRDRIVRSEQKGATQMSRSPIRYSHKAFIEKIAENERDTTPRAVYADWLEENAPESATPEVLRRLRHYKGRMAVGLSPKGKVLAIPTVTKKWIEDNAGTWGMPSGNVYHRTSRNSKGQAHGVRFSGKMKTWKREPDRYRIPWKFGLYQSGEITPQNEHEWLIEDPTSEPEEGGYGRSILHIPDAPQQLSRRRFAREAV